MNKNNNSSKKTTKKSFFKNKYYFVLGIAFLIVILLFILLVKSLLNINRPNSYSIDSRIEKVAEKKENLKTDANYDVVGWVRVQGTKIDFPVVSGKDRSFKSPVETTGYGWLTTYGDTRYHNVLNIYGHNIMNLGREPLISDESFERFEELLAFTDYDFAKKNQYFQYTMDGKDNLYKIFAVSILDSTSLVGLPEDDYDDGELSRYVKMIKEGSLYDYDVKVTTDDDIVSLATCTALFATGSDYNVIVISGKKVLDGESIESYSINKKSKYKDLENEMKGDVDDE